MVSPSRWATRESVAVKKIAGTIVSGDSAANRSQTESTSITPPRNARPAATNLVNQ
jgi:hypothetical protein